MSLEEFAVPKEVDEAANLAEELHAKMYNTETQPDSEEETDDTEEDVSEPEEVEDDTPEVEDTKFEQKYKTLQGIHNAEVKRMKEEIELLKQSINKPVVPEVEPEDPYAELTEEYGEDFVSKLRKAIAAETKHAIKPVEEQTASIESTQIQAAQENFKNYLDGKAEGWRELWSSLEDGSNPKFMEFLKSPDPSGLYTYADLVQQYNDAWDADKLAIVFNKFNETATTKPKQTKPNPTKDAVIAPSRQQSSPTPTSVDKKIWTTNDVADFQRRDRMGEFTDEVSQALWHDLMSAPAEGRVR